jgi:hypothetical protein
MRTGHEVESTGTGVNRSQSTRRRRLLTPLIGRAAYERFGDKAHTPAETVAAGATIAFASPRVLELDHSGSRVLGPSARARQR